MLHVFSREAGNGCSPGKPPIASAEAIHPGRDRPVAVPVVASPDGSLRLDVPVARGCAMVRLKRE